MNSHTHTHITLTHPHIYTYTNAHMYTNRWDLAVRLGNRTFSFILTRFARQLSGSVPES